MLAEVVQSDCLKITLVKPVQTVSEYFTEITAHAMEAFSRGSHGALENRTWVLGQFLPLTDFVTFYKPHEAKYSHMKNENKQSIFFGGGEALLRGLNVNVPVKCLHIKRAQ